MTAVLTLPEYLDPSPVVDLLDSKEVARVFRTTERSGCRRRARWRARGLTVAEADVVAVYLGHHPAEIWGVAWWAIGEGS